MGFIPPSYTTELWWTKSRPAGLLGIPKSRTYGRGGETYRAMNVWQKGQMMMMIMIMMSRAPACHQRAEELIPICRAGHAGIGTWDFGVRGYCDLRLHDL
jgi:hypothetical protein